MSVEQISQAGHSSTVEVESLIWNICAEQRTREDVLLHALKHHLSSGGQRTRTRLSLACSKALGLPPGDSTALAATVECLHNASLVQDDLQDGSSLRRSKEPVWKRYDRDTALCLTDLLISAAYTAIGRVGTPDRIPKLIQSTHLAIAQTLRGQMQDTTSSRAATNILDESLEIAAAKSSPFFALSFVLPLIAASQDTHVETAQRACRHFGIGYQAYDDLEDLEQDEREGNKHNIILSIGKPGDQNLPVIQGVKLAVYHLKKAAALATALPGKCGAPLADQAGKLQSKAMEIVL